MTDPEQERILRKTKKTPVIVLYLQHPEKIDLLDEFKTLLNSADKDIVEIFVQHKYPTSSHYLGKGFLEEIQDQIKEEAKYKDIQEVLVNTELSPLQFFNINKFFSPLLVIDRFQLVLEIFEKNSHSKESKLQIELAQLQYNVIFEKQRYLHKMTGGTLDSIGGTERRGFAGTGELKIDTILGDHRKKERIIKRKITKIKKDRATRRKSRTQQNFLSISLVGYTNAGKSSLLNILTDTSVEVEGKFFTTLSTTTRSFKLHDLTVTVTDTVGFIQELPTQLIDAFRSTLEESLTTDYVAIVVDVSETISDIERKLETTLDILKEIGVDKERFFLIINKIDLAPSKELIWIEDYLSSLPIAKRPRCYVSVRKKDLAQFYKLIEALPLVKNRLKKYQLAIPVQLKSLHTLKSELYDTCQILNERTVFDVQSDSYKLVMELHSRQPTKFTKLIAKIEISCINEDLEFSYIELNL